MSFFYDKKVKVSRFSETLGEYNRPNRALAEIGEYPCMVAQKGSNTSQLQTQKQNTTDYDLYTDPEADITTGDILLIYEVDEYEHIIQSTESKAIADKPYKKRTQLKVPLLAEEEV